MALNQSLVPSIDVADLVLQMAYPATALVFELKVGLISIHLIWYTAAPAALFNNAPNGSVLFDRTNHHSYLKSGTVGAIDGTWNVNT
jgi:hypothetical protein